MHTPAPCYNIDWFFFCIYVCVEATCIVVNICARLGGWVLDGFPLTREQWAGMLEQQLIPDCVISLQDNSDKSIMLAERVAELKGIEKPATSVVAAGMDTATGENIPENV